MEKFWNVKDNFGTWHRVNRLGLMAMYAANNAMVVLPC